MHALHVPYTCAGHFGLIVAAVTGVYHPSCHPRAQQGVTLFGASSMFVLVLGCHSLQVSQVSLRPGVITGCTGTGMGETPLLAQLQDLARAGKPGWTRRWRGGRLPGTGKLPRR